MPVTKTLSSLSRVAVVVLLTLMLGVAGCSRDVPQLLRDAKQYHQKGDRAAAIIALKIALDADPRNGEARFLLGALYNEIQDGPSAEKELRRAIELGVIQGGRAFAELGHAMLLQGNYKEMLEAAKPSESFEPDALAHIWADRGRAQIALRSLEKARSALEEATRANARNPETLMLAALIKLIERDIPAVETLLDQALVAYPANVEIRMMKADLLRMQKKFDEAMAAYGKILEIEPKAAHVRVALGTLYLQQGKTAEAQKEVDAVRAVYRDYIAAIYLQALIQFDAGKLRESQSTIQDVLKVAPNYAPAVLLSGSIHYSLGSFAQAEAALTRVLLANPRNVYARKLLAATRLALNDGKGALEVISPALGKGVRDGTAAALAGDALLQMGDFSKATEMMEQAATLDPDNPAFRTRLGVGRLIAGDQEGAIADLEAAARLDSKYRADFTLILTLLHAKQFDRVFEAIAALEKKLPNTPIADYFRGIAYFGKSDVVNARKSMERSLAIDPAYFPAASFLGEQDLRDGDATAARKRFEAILAKNDKSAPAMLALAGLLANSGDRPQALKLLMRAASENPTLAEAQIRLINFQLERAESRKEALGTASEAQRLMPEDPAVLDALGMAQLSNGEVNRALATFGKVVLLQPKSAIAHYRLALAKMVMNDSKGAEDSLKTTLDLDPKFRNAIDSLGKIQLAAGRTSEAMATARRQQKEYPKFPDGYAMEGDVLMAQRNYAQAVKSYQAAMRLAESGALTVKAYMAEVRAGHADAGRKRLEAWVAAHPDDLSTRSFLADSYLQTGENPAAIKHYEYIAQRSPDDLQMLNNLANAYQAVKDRRALEVAERIHKLRPENPLITDTLAWILFEQGDTQRSLQLLESAASAAPKAGTIRYHYAVVLAKSGARDKARKEIESLLAAGQRFPEIEQAKALLKTL